MQPIQILHKHPELFRFAVPAAQVEQVNELLDLGLSLEELLRRRELTLTHEQRHVVWRLWHEAQNASARFLNQNQARAKARQELISPVLALEALLGEGSDDFAVLLHLMEDLPPGSLSKHIREEAILAGLSLWRSCLTHLFEECPVRVGSLRFPPLERCSRERQGELIAALNTGESLDFDWPIDAFSDAAVRCGAALNSLARGRQPEQFFRALFEPYFAGALLDKLRWKSRTEIIEELSDWLRERMKRPKAEGQSFGGLWTSPSGLTIVTANRDGKLLSHKKFEGYEDDPATLSLVVMELLRSTETKILAHSLEGQEGAPAEALLEQLELRELTLTPLSNEALNATHWIARQSYEVQGALRLVQRVIRPSRFWGQSDLELLLIDRLPTPLLPWFPLHSLLVELQEQRLRIVSELKQPQREKKKPAPKTVQRPENTIQSMGDATRGMPLKGVVTRLKAFGAFVDLGLEQEGMIHLSELSEKRVSHPSHILKVGQEVEIHVLSVDLARRRLSLTLRGAPEPPRGEQREEEQSSVTVNAPARKRGGRGRRSEDGDRGGPRRRRGVRGDGGREQRDTKRGESRVEKRGDNSGNHRGENRGNHRGESQENHRGENRGNHRGESQGNQRGNHRGDNQGDTKRGENSRRDESRGENRGTRGRGGRGTAGEPPRRGEVTRRGGAPHRERRRGGKEGEPASRRDERSRRSPSGSGSKEGEKLSAFESLFSKKS